MAKTNAIRTLALRISSPIASANNRYSEQGRLQQASAE
jgi:hypothetical protein